MFTSCGEGRRQALIKARIATPKVKVDGTNSKVLDIRFVCAGCKEQFVKKEVEVDHIKPVNIKLKWPADNAEQFYNWAKSVLCDESNLQVLCKPCHKIKSGKEATKRAKVRRKARSKAIPT